MTEESAPDPVVEAHARESFPDADAVSRPPSGGLPR